MNILIVNQPLNNRGDESAHRALVRSIIKYIPEANVVCLFKGSNPDSVRQFMVKHERVKYVDIIHKRGLKSEFFLKKGWNHPLLWKFHPYVREFFSYYKWADAVVCAPGGICMGGFMNWGHEWQLMYAMKFHKPVYYYGRSIGPFWDEPADKKLFKERAIKILNYCSYISLREAESLRIANSLGIKNVIETVDTAFLDYPEVEIPSEIKNQIGNGKYVVFVPNLLIWHPFYKGRASRQQVVDFWKKVVDVISKHYPNHKIVMLPQTFNYGNDDDDIHIFHDIQKSCYNRKLIVISDTYSSDIQQVIIRKADAMFGSRYHSIVFSINNNVPFVAFNYEHKISGLLEELGLTDNMIDIRDLFTSESFNCNVINRFDKILPSIHNSKEAQIKAKEIASSSFKKFLISF